MSDTESRRRRNSTSGKTPSSGRAAAFEASAAKRDIERIRQELAEEASQAYYDYFLVFRSIAINAESVEIVKQLKANAESRFATGKALQQDVLQADVETGRLEEQRLSLTRLEAVNRARLNTLLNREPNESLGTVPDELITPMPSTSLRRCKHERSLNGRSCKLLLSRPRRAREMGACV